MPARSNQCLRSGVSLASISSSRLMTSSMPCRSLTKRPTIGTAAASKSRRREVAGTAAARTRVRPEAAIGSEPLRFVIIVYLLTPRARHLNRCRRLPLLGIGDVQGAPALWAPLVSILLIGGFGYKDVSRLFPPCPVEHLLPPALESLPNHASR